MEKNKESPALLSSKPKPSSKATFSGAQAKSGSTISNWKMPKL
jgi:hypothetical protein